jgi:phosphoribosylaminoimidazole-succinocarboxamide synthase
MNAWPRSWAGHWRAHRSPIWVHRIAARSATATSIANYWFAATADIVPNHLVDVPDPNVIRARECELVALEFVVRAYITGVTKTSLWFNYEQGKREVAGNKLRDGLRKNERLPQPILTPTTKLEEHDRNVSRAEAVREGLISEALFDRITSISFELFDRGTEVAAERGLILVDTKYEFGLVDDEVVLIDEVHTPDSSRFWYADTYDERRPSPTTSGSLRPAGTSRWRRRSRSGLSGRPKRRPASECRPSSPDERTAGHLVSR